MFRINVESATGKMNRSRIGRLNEAIRHAAKAGKLKLTDKDRDALRAARLDAPSRGFPKFGR